MTHDGPELPDENVTDDKRLKRRANHDRTSNRPPGVIVRAGRKKRPGWNRPRTFSPSGALPEVDLTNLCEYLGDMARERSGEVLNRLITLITHLLKWEREPEKRTNFLARHDSD